MGWGAPESPKIMRPTKLAFTLLLTTIAPGQPPSSSPSLARMRDHFREVLIFAPEGDPRLSRQVEALRPHRAELIERDIRLVPFTPKYAGHVDSAIITLLPRDEPHLRKRLDVAQNDFLVILIGKDGGEKLRSAEPISFEKLRDTIDAMPMRQDESKRKR